MGYGRPAWAEIDLLAIKKNMEQIKTLIKPGVLFCPILKADAYGHGAPAVARIAEQLGADYVGVAVLDEAIALRDSGVTLPILVLGPTEPHLSSLIVGNRITQTIFTKEQADALSAAAKAIHFQAKVHIKIETGMSRVGVAPDEAADFYAYVKKLPNLDVEGTFTHFASADSLDKTSAQEQFALFTQVTEAMEAKAGPIPIKHCANSAAILDMPQTHLDMVRAGVIIYGLWPSSEVTHPITLTPAMQLKARATMVKTVDAGTRVSYGGRFQATAPTTVATFPIGYADGFTRMLSGKTKIVINGAKAPIVGSICMDQCMADVTGIDKVQVGTEALIFGGKAMPVEDIADLLGTINYEVVCMVGKRIPRLYINKE